MPFAPESFIDIDQPQAAQAQRLRDDEAAERRRNPMSRESTGANGVYLLIDHGTGCSYLEVWGRAITPRLTSDGHPDCDPSRKQ